MKFFIVCCVFISGLGLGYLLSPSHQFDNKPVASFAGGQLNLLDLEAHLDPELQAIQRQFYKRLSDKVESAVYERFIQGPETFVNPDEVQFNEIEFKKYLEAQNVTPKALTRLQYQNFYDNYRLKVAQRKVDSYVENKIKELNIQLTLPKPILPRITRNISGLTYSKPRKWSSPDFILVQNYTCAHCAESFKSFQQWQKRYHADFEFSLLTEVQNLDEVQSYILKVAKCASKKNLTKEFHDRLFQVTEINIKNVNDLAASLDLGQVEKCEALKEENLILQASQRPYFLIDGYVVDYAEDSIIIDSLVRQVK